jgi:diguanylate cyclase (GGDEF)-like protein/PAS domain S-box-containing protein
MSQSESIRLLILNNSRAEAERLISMLHAAGRPCRPQHVDSEEVLTKLLQEQNWDLLIGSLETTNVTPAAAIKHIRRLNKDVPVVLQFDDEDSLSPVIEGLRLGAADVVSEDADQHLLLVIDREMKNREQRQARRIADKRFHEAERRSQELLDSSRDAIAYVQDGLFLYANQSFADLFEYTSSDDIEALPIMDVVAEKDHSLLKNYLKDFTFKGTDAESTTISFTAKAHNGSEKQVDVEIAQVTYDEEPCIQLLMRANHSLHAVVNEELEAQLKQIKHQDFVTGAFNRQYLISQLDQLIAQDDEDKKHALLYIDLVNFAQDSQQIFGQTETDIVLAKTAAFIGQNVQEQDIFARLNDSTFALLIKNTKTDAAVSRANSLAETINTHIIEIDNKTQQLHSRIGISLINDTSVATNNVIEQACNAAEKTTTTQSVALFEPDEPQVNSRNLKDVLQYAMDNNRFRLLFQPIISLRGSDEEYYEVYLRLLNENDEEISPKEFLDTATKLGALTKIDRWVIFESIKMLAEHRTRGNKTKLIVNLSPDSLCDETLLSWLGLALKAAKLPAGAITFQAREIDVTSHINSAKAFSEGLQKLQAPFAISNFGCSLNPFNTLKHVNASFIKIDGSFTNDIQNNNESPETLVNLIEQLNAEQKTTLVPFVENSSVLSTLWQAGAHYIQGHYLQEPSHNMSFDFNMES